MALQGQVPVYVRHLLETLAEHIPMLLEDPNQSPLIVTCLTPLPIYIGVPQGFILSFDPLFYLLVLNDLHCVTDTCLSNMFIGDTDI